MRVLRATPMALTTTSACRTGMVRARHQVIILWLSCAHYVVQSKHTRLVLCCICLHRVHLQFLFALCDRVAHLAGNKQRNYADACKSAENAYVQFARMAGILNTPSSKATILKTLGDRLTYAVVEGDLFAQRGDQSDLGRAVQKGSGDAGANLIIIDADYGIKMEEWDQERWTRKQFDKAIEVQFLLRCPRAVVSRCLLRCRSQLSPLTSLCQTCALSRHVTVRVLVRVSSA